MFYVYILLRKNGTKYVGFTSELKRRILEHKKGKVRSTRYVSPKLIYYECYIDKIDAQQREKFLKTGDGRKELNIQLKETINNAVSPLT